MARRTGRRPGVVNGTTRDQVVDLRMRGWKGPQIARQLGISHQAVYQFLKSARSGVHGPALLRFRRHPPPSPDEGNGAWRALSDDGGGP